MSYDSVTSQPDRMAKVKNYTMFYEDLANDLLPQWMFITPNMSMSPFLVAAAAFLLYYGVGEDEKSDQKQPTTATTPPSP